MGCEAPLAIYSVSGPAGLAIWCRDTLDITWSLGTKDILNDPLDGDLQNNSMWNPLYQLADRIGNEANL